MGTKLVQLNSLTISSTVNGAVIGTSGVLASVPGSSDSRSTDLGVLSTTTGRDGGTGFVSKYFTFSAVNLQ